MGLGLIRQRRPHGRPTPCRRAAGAWLAVVPFAVLAGPASAQAVSDTASAEARAAILESGSLVKLDDIRFGQIVQPTASGTVVLSPTASATCGLTGGVLVRTGPCTSAQFSIMGRKNWFARIRETNGGIVVLTGPGGATMTMTNITHTVQDMTPVGGGGNAAGTLGRYRITSDSGIATFRIGGTLNVGANQAVGTYNGTLNVQVQFQ